DEVGAEQVRHLLAERVAVLVVQEGLAVVRLVADAPQRDLALEGRRRGRRGDQLFLRLVLGRGSLGRLLDGDRGRLGCAAPQGGRERARECAGRKAPDIRWHGCSLQDDVVTMRAATFASTLSQGEAGGRRRARARAGART